MSLLAFDSFDHYTSGAYLLATWTSNLHTAYGSIIVAEQGRNGSSALYYHRDFSFGLSRPTAAHATWIVGMWMNPGTWGGTDTWAAFMAFQYSGSTQVSFQWDGAHYLKAYRGSTLLGTSVDAWPSGEQGFLEIKVTVDNASGLIEVRRNGQSFLSLSGIDTQAQASALVDGFTGTGGAQSCVAYLDDIYVLNGDGASFNDFLGDAHVQALLPDGAGAYSEWTPSAGANYENVDDAAPDDDTTYNSTDTAENKDSFSYGALPSTPATIHGVQQIIALRKDDAGTRTVRPFLRIGNTDYFGDAVSIADTYGYTIRYLWETNPATNAAWTAAAIDGLEAGYELVS